MWSGVGEPQNSTKQYFGTKNTQRPTRWDTSHADHVMTVVIFGTTHTLPPVCVCVCVLQVLWPSWLGSCQLISWDTRFKPSWHHPSVPLSSSLPVLLLCVSLGESYFEFCKTGESLVCKYLLLFFTIRIGCLFGGDLYVLDLRQFNSMFVWLSPQSAEDSVGRWQLWVSGVRCVHTIPFSSLGNKTRFLKTGITANPT